MSVANGPARYLVTAFDPRIYTHPKLIYNITL